MLKNVNGGMVNIFKFAAKYVDKVNYGNQKNFHISQCIYHNTQTFNI